MSNPVAQYVDSIRSKNAGPFWVTIDLFCTDTASYQYLCKHLANARVAAALHQPASALKRFDIDTLQVVKFSLPRPVVQGHHSDRDMHGAQWAVLIQELDISD